MSAIPLILCGQSEEAGKAFTEAVQPDFEGKHPFPPTPPPPIFSTYLPTCLPPLKHRLHPQ